MSGVTDPVPFLVRRRPVLALLAALAAGVAATASVRGAEPHLEADVSAPVGRDRLFYTLLLRARGGGALTEIVTSCEDSRASIPRDRIERLGPGQESRVHVDLRADVGDSEPVVVRVAYRNPEPRVLEVLVGSR
jgi:hypothetical protein